MTIERSLKKALGLYEGRQYSEAEALYRQVLTRHPNNPLVLHLLGVVLARLGRREQAIESYRQALALKPDFLDALNNLGAALQETGQPNEAIETFQRALLINPNIPGLHNNLGNALQSAGRLDEAIECHRHAIQLNPKIPEPHNSLANALRSKGLSEQAVASYRQAISLRPDFPQALNNLAVTLLEQRDLEQALTCAQKTVALHPKYPEAHNTLALILKAQGNLQQAIASYQRAIDLRPGYADAYNNLGIAFQSKGLMDEAITAFERSVSIKADLADAQSNLGFALKEKGFADRALIAFEKALVLKPKLLSAHLNLGLFYRERGNLDQSLVWYHKALTLHPETPLTLNGLANTEKDRGNVVQALTYFRQALALSPDSSTLNSNLLYTLHFQPDVDAQSILEEHRQWDQRIAVPLRNEMPATQSDPLGHRRIRVGYVSSDLRGHVVGRHLLPLLANHNHAQFEIFCYTGVRNPDAFTHQLQQHADQWRNTLGLSDSQLAELVRADRIDILVDLTLHMAATRLLAFAQKPAPIQLTYLGYCSTTGLSAMDYRLSDPYLDPPGTDHDYVEQTIRLPRTYWCYQLKGATPDVSALPAERAGHVTFGCLNNFAKVSTRAQDVWARLLVNVPHSCLVIHCGHGSHRVQLVERFARVGVSSDRIHFFTGGTWDTYMHQYNQIDIALDPFPYGGGITTCDGLWMGVPIVTLTGQTAVGRGGTSILSNLGLPELIARDVEEYLRIAADLANDLPRLVELRQTLRQRIQQSSLMDAVTFARDFETVYRRLAESRLPHVDPSKKKKSYTHD
jgi:protein O-GlcNAc transferase